MIEPTTYKRIEREERVEAIRLTTDNIEDVAEWSGGRIFADRPGRAPFIAIKRGVAAVIGEMVIRERNGSIWTTDSGFFEQIYTPLEGDPPPAMTPADREARSRALSQMRAAGLDETDARFTESGHDFLIGLNGAEKLLERKPSHVYVVPAADGAEHEGVDVFLDRDAADAFATRERRPDPVEEPVLDGRFVLETSPEALGQS